MASSSFPASAASLDPLAAAASLCFSGAGCSPSLASSPQEAAWKRARARTRALGTCLGTCWGQLFDGGSRESAQRGGPKHGRIRPRRPRAKTKCLTRPRPQNPARRNRAAPVATVPVEFGDLRAGMRPEPAASTFSRSSWWPPCTRPTRATQWSEAGPEDSTTDATRARCACAMPLSPLRKRGRVSMHLPKRRRAR